MPSAVSSYVMVALVGAGAGLYLDFAVLSFHVPTVGSAATSSEANPKRANTSFVCRILSPSAGIIPRWRGWRIGRGGAFQVVAAGSGIWTAASRAGYQRLIWSAV